MKDKIISSIKKLNSITPKINNFTAYQTVKTVIAELEQALTTKDSITADNACDCPNGQGCKAFTDGDCEVLQGKQEVV